MSDFEYDEYEEPNFEAAYQEPRYSDPNMAAWEAALNNDPVGTIATIAGNAAQQAAYQSQPDTAAIAGQVLAQSIELQRIAAENAATESQARLVHDSLVAQHGQDFVTAAPEIARELANDPEFLKAHDAQSQADYIEGKFLELRKQPSRKFREVMSAPSNKLGL